MYIFIASGPEFEFLYLHRKCVRVKERHSVNIIGMRFSILGLVDSVAVVGIGFSKVKCYSGYHDQVLTARRLSYHYCN